MDDNPTHADTTPLPDDLSVCHRLIRELLEQLVRSERNKEQLAHRIELLLRRMYGTRSEKIDPNQLLLAFANEADDAEPELAKEREEPPANDPAEPRKRKRGGHGRGRLPENLPRREVLHDLSEAQRLCPECGCERCRIGAETSEQLDYEPASLFVRVHVRATYACKSCEGHVETAPKPPQPIEKGLPGPGLMAQVITGKYADHLPLNRQRDIFNRHGVAISRKTMWDWVARGSEELEPIYRAMLDRVLQSKKIHTDDTPVRVQLRGQAGTQQSRLWIYVGDAAHPYSVFDYTPSRCRDGPARILDGYEGYVQADAFSGYDAIYTGSNGRIVEVACWAHARRKFDEAKSSDPTNAYLALAHIGRLYEIERAAKQAGLDDEQRWRLRQERSLTVLEEIHAWLEQTAMHVLPKSPMGKAIRYTQSNWPALKRYTQAGFLDIDNNLAERLIRAVAIGRKNWLFIGSHRGGKAAAICFSFTTTCKHVGVDPFAYLRDILSRVGTHPASRIEELLPDRWLAEHPEARLLARN